MAWYDDKKRTTYVAIYESDKTMKKEVEEASKKGWIVQSATSTAGHVHMGRALMTGGLTLLFGGGRSKDKVTVVFGRDEEWLKKDKP